MRHGHVFFLTLGALVLSGAAESAEVIVNIKDFAFDKQSITITEGDTVTWANADGVSHTTTSGTNCKADNQWNSGLLSQGASFSHTFTTEGTYPYFCAPHCSGGMTGTVTVKKATVEDARITRGLAIAPVKLNMKGVDPDLVGLGSYLVNAPGSCADCHSCPTYAEGGNPFKGEPMHLQTDSYLAGGVAFGPFLSRNLTPNKFGKPAGLSLAQFMAAMKTGKDHMNAHPDISDLLQVMPWPIYGQMVDRDLTAIYQYLKAIPRAKPPATACTSPGQ